jgi:hypothetical protein
MRPRCRNMQNRRGLWGPDWKFLCVPQLSVNGAVGRKWGASGDCGDRAQPSSGACGDLWGLAGSNKKSEVTDKSTLLLFSPHSPQSPPQIQGVRES